MQVGTAARAAAEVWLGDTRTIVAGLSRGPIAWALDGDVVALDSVASDEDLGSMVVGLLDRGATTVDAPVSRPLFAAAGVRSYRQLYREYVVVSVDREGDELRFDPWIPGSRGLVGPAEDRHRLLHHPVDDAEVGRVVREVARHSRRLTDT